MSAPPRRILLLGAAGFQLPAVERAREMGLHVVTADNRPGNPGHRLADAWACASTTDREAVLAVAREHRVDGVMTFGSDVSAPAAAWVAERLGLPGNPYEAVCTLVRKDRFRAFQRDHGFPHPAFCATADLGEARAFLRALGGPAMVKPVDASGSKGITRVGREEELPARFALALEHSRAGLVCLEAYLSHEDRHVCGDGFLVDGRLAFLELGDSWFLRGSEYFTPIGETYPCTLDPAHVAGIRATLDRMFAALGLRTGAVNVDAIVSGGRPYVLEIGPRNGGNHIPTTLRHATGVDLVGASLRAALGERVAFPPRTPGDCRPTATYAVSSRRAGVFERLDFSPVVAPRVLERFEFAAPGDAVRVYTRTDYKLATVILGFPDVPAMTAAMRDMERHIRVVLRGDPA